MLTKQLWERYVFHKQTIRELSKQFNKDRITIRALLNRYTPPEKMHTPRPIHLVFDGAYWGELKENTSWCSVVARDPSTKENLWCMFTKSETTSVYRLMRDDLESLGYTYTQCHRRWFWWYKTSV